MVATILRDDDVVCAATWAGVYFEIWRNTAEPEDFRTLGKLALDYARIQEDGKVAQITVVMVTNLTKFSNEARREVEVRSRALDPRLRASVVVLPESGFAAAVVRGVMSGLALMSTSKVPSKVCSSPADACGWLAPLLPPFGGRPIASGQLSRVCDALVSPLRGSETHP